jgi:hypothetical protein
MRTVVTVAALLAAICGTGATGEVTLIGRLQGEAKLVLLQDAYSLA